MNRLSPFTTILCRLQMLNRYAALTPQCCSLCSVARLQNKSISPLLKHQLTKVQATSRCTLIKSAISHSTCYSTSADSGVDKETNLPLYDAKKGYLVYTGPIAPMIKVVKLFSISTSLIGLGLQPYIIFNATGSVMVKAVTVGIVSIFIFITPLLIHFVSGKYITEMYYNEPTDTFTATVRTLFAWKKDIVFTSDDVVVPDIAGMFTSMLVKGRPLFADTQSFRDKDVYIRLMGYDKPLEWELDPPEEDDSKKNL